MAWQSNTIDPATTTPAADISKIKNDLGVIKVILEGGTDPGVATNITVTWSGISGKPATFPPSAHTHVIADVSGLQTALDGKQATIAAGTTAQYWRGDKTWQALNKAAVGLGNVDNTADVDKPVSTAQQTAIDLAKDIPQVVQNANATFALSDRGKHWIKDNTTAYTWTIPLNSAVAFPIGTAITVRNKSGTGAVTIAKTAGVVLRKPGAATDLTTVTLAVWGQATLVKEGTNDWVISGTGI